MNILISPNEIHPRLDIMPIGTYKGYTYFDIMQRNPGYILFLVENFTDWRFPDEFIERCKELALVNENQTE